MHSIAVRVENLGKIYDLSNNRATTFKEQVYRKIKNPGKTRPNQIIALEQVSFEVHQGEAMGIIGRNGSGKSTLLKILSGITAPTSGRVEISGRVASVLDLGMGFHPDLTGMDNIYLSGELLGMKRAQIKQKLDEIIDFSEIERFIESPVKYYSSGMFLRLAFSIMAHLDADILLLDEVLSVGDASFQIKSYQKMQKLLTSGKTVILVSHVLPSLSRYTSRCLLLQNGRLIGIDHTDAVISKYAIEVFADSYAGSVPKPGQSSNEVIWEDPGTAPENESIRMHRISVSGGNRNSGETLYTDESLRIEVGFWKLDSSGIIHPGLRINDCTGNPLFATTTLLDTESLDQSYLETPGYKTFACLIPAQLFNSSAYSLDFLATNQHNEICLTIPFVLSFQMVLRNANLIEILYQTSAYPFYIKTQWMLP